MSTRAALLDARRFAPPASLATVRRLLVAPVQVNIGRNQIISQGGPAVTASE